MLVSSQNLFRGSHNMSAGFIHSPKHNDAYKTASYTSWATMPAANEVVVKDRGSIGTSI